MTRYEERRRRKVEQLGEELMRIQMRGCRNTTSCLLATAACRLC